MPDMHFTVTQLAAGDRVYHFLGKRERHIDSNLFVLPRVTHPDMQITFGRGPHHHLSAKNNNQKRQSSLDHSHAESHPELSKSVTSAEAPSNPLDGVTRRGGKKFR